MVTTPYNLPKGLFMVDDITTNGANAGRMLEDESSTGKKRPWRKQKMGSRAIAASLYRCWKKHPRKNAALKKRSDWMQQCGNYLVFGDVVNPETGEVARKLQAAQFCRDRLCPMCQWRKSLVTFHQLSEIMDRVDADHPNEFIPIFLTLTMKNVPNAELGTAITRILQAWSRMMNKSNRRKPWRVTAGWFRSLEITYNPDTAEWHPHIHAILLVPADYFTDADKYIDHDAWVAEWHRALRADYDPSVDVRTIKAERAHAVAEVSKYAVKPGEWVNLDDADGTDERVGLLAVELKGRRLTAFGGVMKEARAALKQEDAETADLVHTGEDAEVRGDLLVALDRFEWQVGVTNYVRVKRDVLVEPPSE